MGQVVSGVGCLRGGLSPGHIVSWGGLSPGHIISGQIVLGHIVSGHHVPPPGILNPCLVPSNVIKLITILSLFGSLSETKILSQIVI